MLIFGGYQNDDYCHINFKNYKINQKEDSNKIGYDNIRNMRLNSGLVGRAGDETGRKFGKILDELIIKGELTFPPNYYNDELYFMLAFQLAVKDTRNKGKLIPTGIVCTTHGADIINREGKHSVYKKLSGEGLIENPAIIHYVSKINSKEYRDVFYKNLPSNYEPEVSSFFSRLRLE